MTDGNSNVSALALKSLVEVMPLFGGALVKVMHVLMPPLCQAAGGNNQSIFQLCEEASIDTGTCLLVGIHVHVSVKCQGVVVVLDVCFDLGTTCLGYK